ncbi:hypothetical protein AVEN_63067-1 [Araneus ventricosus]|uniref:Uncharacterized protein n=1 Tax=Araneus ventricosus TaxID=182803 RepID=A0A4Y2V7Z6_ARAVE|nr:hypothetical protein AVEN_63067-1 [Araneus ventricosus]
MVAEAAAANLQLNGGASTSAEREIHKNIDYLSDSVFVPIHPRAKTPYEESPAKTVHSVCSSSYIPEPRCHIKSLLLKQSIIRWQTEWDNGETGRSVCNVLPNTTD